MAPKPSRPTEKFLYKYFSNNNLKYLKAVILDNELYFPKVDELNDPAEGKPKLRKINKEQLIEFLVKSYVLNNPHLSVNDYEKAKAEIIFGCNKFGEGILLELMSEDLNSLFSKYRIFCLSKRYDNMSLWAKYANDHKGYCLEFRNNGFFKLAHEVTYTNEITELDLANKEEINSFFLYTKKNDWSNEEEVRIVPPLKLIPPYKFEPLLLSKIILGKDMSDYDETQIQDWAKQRIPKLNVVKASYDEFEHKLNLLER